MNFDKYVVTALNDWDEYQAAIKAINKRETNEEKIQ